jgi:hypothetical protein
MATSTKNASSVYDVRRTYTFQRALPKAVASKPIPVPGISKKYSRDQNETFEAACLSSPFRRDVIDTKIAKNIPAMR